MLPSFRVPFTHASKPSVLRAWEDQHLFGSGVGAESPGTILLIVLVLVLVGALPNWATASWGRGPSGMIGVVLIVVLILVLLGKIRPTFML